MNQSDQADNDDVAAQTARLEAALERIAALASSARSHDRPADVTPQPDAPLLSEIATRLDNTIARLRAAIGER